MEIINKESKNIVTEEKTDDRSLNIERKNNFNINESSKIVNSVPARSKSRKK